MSSAVDLINSVFNTASAITAIISIATFAIFAIRSVVLKGDELNVNEERARKIEKEISQARAGKQNETQPFEISALSSYYNQALSRAQISFWFSLVFASIGFGVIIFAFILHSSSDLGGTAIKVASGAVIDAVSALFFVQSTNAQKSMGEFFEKLRLDRLNAEAREMIGDIENSERRDQLRAQLVLKYSGIDKLLQG